MQRRVLLIGWDAADWKVIHPLLDAGQMPHLAGIVNGGVVADLATLSPVLSPLLWNSIATGKRASEHGIIGFTEPDPATGHIRPVTSTSRRVKALWNILAQQGVRTHAVNWYASHPAEPLPGIVVSDAFDRGIPAPDQPWPLMPGTVHPAAYADEVAALRVHPSEIAADLVSLFVPRWAEVDQQKDQRLASVMKLQAEMFGVHAAATWAMRREPWDFLAVFYPSIDHFSHAFMRYHPPRMENVDERSFELYSDVVNSAYRTHDLMLGTLLRLAGEDTTVILVSDHGFHPDHRRPKIIPRVPAGPAEQHRGYGILAMRGPGIRADERVYGVNLLDIAPTVLALFGLPAGADMPGRVIAEAFSSAPPLRRIPSWERVPGECGMHTAEAAMSGEDARAMIEQFIALGYIEKPPEDQEKALAGCVRERNWNLARVLLEAGRLAEALPLLEQVHAEVPERGEIALTLADTQAKLGLLEEAEATAELAIAAHRDTPLARWTLANIRFDRGDMPGALQHLLAAEAAGSPYPWVHLKIGTVYLRMRRREDAERSYRRALELDPESAAACEGLARSALARRAFDDAAGFALDAIGLQYALPWSHLYLGIALTRLGVRERAAQAFDAALALAPNLGVAHRWLARLHFEAGDQAANRRHIRAARDCQRRREEAQRATEQLRAEARLRAAERPAPAAPAAEGQSEDAAERAASGRDLGPALEFVIVSGLPRSGTSLMMQMLDAAGVPVMTDGERRPDSDNPRGYFEWERVKKLPRHPEILREAEGKAIKVISMLLPSLPNRHRYRVLFMDRPIEEVAASHRRMLENRGRTVKAAPERTTEAMARHRAAVLERMEGQPNVDLLVVDYPGLVADPADWLPRISAFLGGALDEKRLATAIRPELHRHRTPKGSA